MRTGWLSASILTIVLILAGCGQGPEDPGQDQDDSATQGLDLAGLWLVTHEGTTSSDERVTETLEFGEAPTGRAIQLVHDGRSNVTRCGAEEYALLADGDVLFDGLVYEVERPAEDQLRLDYGSGSVVMNLERVDERPVEPCGVVETSYYGRVLHSIHFQSNLHAAASDLYFTLDKGGGTSDNPIVRYDVGDQTIAAEYGDPYHSRVLGVAGEDLVFGSCFCGLRRTIAAYDLAAGTTVATLEDLTHPDGFAVRVQAGYYDDEREELVLAVRNPDDLEQYLLRLVPDPDGDAATDDTFVVGDEALPILPGENINDLTMFDGQLWALVGDAIVSVGDDGMALETLTLEGLNGQPRGIASVGSVLYVLTESDERGYLRVALLP